MSFAQDFKEDASLRLAVMVLWLCFAGWGAFFYVLPQRLVANYGEPFCETALGKGWHTVTMGPDQYHTWCAMDKP